MSTMTELTTTQVNKIEEPILLRADREGVTTLTLNRPKHYNALSEAMLAALQTALDQIATDSAIRVVVLAANGKAFCAGHDLKQMRATPNQDYYTTLFNQCSRMMLTIHQLPQPVIAKVQGIATAAGCQLVAACDLAVAAAGAAKFATSGINVGLFCATPAVPVSRNIARKQAMDMLLTGDFIDAQTALAWGLVNRLAPTEQLDAAVDELAQAILAKSFVAVSMGKQMFYKQLEMGLSDAYRYASEVMACNMIAEDAGEGIDAFIEKRPATWKHR